MKRPRSGSLQPWVCLDLLVWCCNIIKRWELRPFLPHPYKFSIGKQFPRHILNISACLLSSPVGTFTSGSYTVTNYFKKKSLWVDIFLLREFWVKFNNDKFCEWRVSREVADRKNSDSSLGVGLLRRFKSTLLPPVTATLLVSCLPWLQSWWFSWLGWRVGMGMGMGQARTPQKLSVMP